MTSFDAHVVDRIVREVMRRLATDTTPNATTTPAAEPAVATSDTPPGTLVLHQRVVALTHLDGKLDGIQRLIVRDDAIITPSVRDLLNERQVRLETAVGEVETGTVRGLLAVAGDAAQAERLAEALPLDDLRWQAYHEVDPLLRDLQQATPARPALGLAITPDWASVVCLANRHPDIRAAAVTDGASLQQACRQLDVNLLVLDPSRLAEEELVNLSRWYLQHRLPAVAGTKYKVTTCVLPKSSAQ